MKADHLGRLVWGEWLALSTGVAFVAAVSVNSAVFKYWGLTFLQVATPQDVLMAGLLFVVRVVPIAIGAALAYWLVRTRSCPMAFLIAVCIVTYVVVLLAKLFSPVVPTRTFSWLILTSLSGMLLGAVHGGVGLKAAKDMLTRRSARFGVAAVGFAVGWWGALGSALVTDVADQGFYAAPTYLREPSLPKCAGRMLWRGERALVVDCGTRRQEIVVLEPDGDVRVEVRGAEQLSRRPISTWSFLERLAR